MTREELLAKLKECTGDDVDKEMGHWDADQALLEFIADEDIAEAYQAVGKWYA
jgi:hypothetical protein